MNDLEQARLVVEKGIPLDCANVKAYKRIMLHLGTSDTATLTLRGYRPQQGVTLDLLTFGGDASYSAWLVFDRALVPAHYTEVASFERWVDVIDDTEVTIKIRGVSRIGVFRAGEMGVLICIDGVND